MSAPSPQPPAPSGSAASSGSSGSGNNPAPSGSSGGGGGSSASSASSLEQYLGKVRSLSAAGNFHDLAEMVAASAEALAKALSSSSGNQLGVALDTLDVTQHSIGMIGVRRGEEPV